MTRYGALCSGIGGLELAVEEVFGFHAAWHSEVDPKLSSPTTATGRSCRT